MQGVDSPVDEVEQPIKRWSWPKRVDWRRIIGGIGITLIVSGLLLLGLIAYQLWGTGIQTREAQRTLANEFNSLVASTSTTTTLPSTSTTEPKEIVIPDPEEGDVIAYLSIEKMNLDVYVVEGVRYRDLKIGPGHYPTTPMIGTLGNAAVAGHRSTYDAPFGDIEKLEVGDKIEVQTTYGYFTYKVTGFEIVEPTKVEVIANPTPDVATLTLTTCHPKFSSDKRYIVYSKLVKEKSPPVKIKTESGDEPTVAPTNSEEAFAEGWWHDSAAWPHVFGWTLSLLAIVALVFGLRRRFATRFKHTTLVAVGGLLIPFLICLYFFYENLSRLLPTNL